MSFREPMVEKVVSFAIIGFSSVAIVLTTGQSAFAQLNIGRYGIQQGLESEYLQYQINNQNLSQMRVIPGCNVGFGLGCNKTGSVVQKLVDLNGGTNYQNLLIQAAGGEKNFQNFASFYGNNPNLSAVPFASFWRNQSPTIMDGSQYLFGQSFSRNPVEGLGLITKQFYWSPYSGVNNSVSLRNGLIDLKLSYGRLLFEEASKISNIREQIQSLGLSPEMNNFYLNKISTGLNALSSGDQKQLQQRIFEVLSFPYSKDGGELGRPNNEIPGEFNHIWGDDITGDILLSDNPLALDGEGMNLDTFPDSVGDVLVQGSPDSFPTGTIIGIGGLTLMMLLLLSGGSSSARSSVSSGNIHIYSPLSINSKGGCNSTPTGNVSDHTPIVEINCSVIHQTTIGVKTVVEPSMVRALVLLIVLLYIVRYKHRSLRPL